jgi:L,D-peptidoglycan transpeptidase YkuD (ErfK/YbiS/YcfS/YnhG family)
MNAADLVLTPRGLRFFGTTYPCSIGKGGRTLNKLEGDGATPVGVHRVVGLLYRADRVSRPADWAVAIGPRDLWSDDPAAPDYNLMVKAPYPHSHEKLRRADPLYDVVLLTDWNWPDAKPGRGSAIFLHQWRRPGYLTEGCIALRRDHLLQIAKAAAPGTRLIVPNGGRRR